MAAIAQAKLWQTSSVRKSNVRMATACYGENSHRVINPVFSRPNSELSRQITILVSFALVFWLVEIVDVFMWGGRLDRLGIMPRSLSGLRGILLAPFLHGGWPHLVANTAPFLFLGWLVMLQRTRDFWWVTLFAMVVGGSGVWLFGHPRSIHIGASMLVFGYLGCLLFRGYFQRDSTSVSIAVLAGALYGGMIFGTLPLQAGVSWEGHLFGFIGGALAARWLSHPQQRPPSNRSRSGRRF